ncbi:amidohydrolase [Dactylosporangium sp. CA-092794]|uniref:amidohydrolase n=1 Tax=Dactylosporangium sp. CA-092794 TaxID=3239929 RepID=UPI003D93AE97
MLFLRDARFAAADERHDILLRGGRIAAVAPRGTLEAPGVRVVDLDGRFVMPGLWDEHVHFTQWVIQHRRLDLSGTASAAEVLARVRTHLAGTPGPLTGYGFRDGLWPDAPTLAGLDAVAPATPVVLISGDLHCAWLNSPAAAMLGATVDASGVLREGPWFAASRDLRAGRLITADDFREAALAAAARGVVGIVDFENTDNIAEWPARVAAGVTALRVEVSVWPDRLDAAIAAGLRTGAPLDPSGLITMGRLKVVVDGSLNTRTALCWDPYPGLDPAHPDACGTAIVRPERLRELLAHAHAHGIAAAVHAIGDRANTEVLDTFEALSIPGTVEHAQLVRDPDVARFAALGLIASVQPEHAMDDRDIADRHWAGRTGAAFAYGSLHRAGVALRLGSDAPVAPLDPWLAIASATSRSRGDREPWHPEQRLSLPTALAASTRGRTGVTLGDPADLVVLDRDPAAATRDELRAMPVAATLVAGGFTWANL